MQSQIDCVMATKKKGKRKFSMGDERIRLIAGLLFVFTSFLALLAFTSYFFTWQEDQSIAELGVSDILSYNKDAIGNWAGKAGILLSAYFVHKWFGVAALGFIFICGLAGLYLWKIRPLPFLQTIKNTFIIIILTSVFLGYFFGDKWFILGGGHGYFVSQWLNTLLGKAGTILFLILLTFVIVVYRFRQLYIYMKERIESVRIPARNGHTENLEREEGMETPLSQVETEIMDGESDITDESNSDADFSEVEIDSEVAGYSDGISFEINETPKDEESEFDIDNTNVESDDEVQTSTAQTKDSAFTDNLVDISVVYPEKEPMDDTNQHLDTESLLENKDEIGMEIAESKAEEEVGAAKTKPLGKYDPRLDLGHYKFPTFDLLPKFEQADSTQRVSADELEANKAKIVETLGNYNIKIDKIKATIGPTVTLYEIIPAPGVRISKIKNLEDDIALSLAALGIRIIAPMPGKGTVGIEVPNQNPEMVSMRSVIASKKFQDTKMQLPIALGKTITNETHVIDLAKLPHLLVAGATGQGKSVGLNVILTSLLYKKHPAELKFVLIDPKKVELSLYNKISNHFLAQIPDAEEPIITDTQKVIATLNSLCLEMDNRYDLLKIAHTRHLSEYNAKFIERRLNPEKGHRFLPYIVVVIDEFADLIMTAGKEIEMPIARLAQLARAIGIHLVIATQRPTTNIITGTIKANFPARIAFRVTSGIDSKTILDSTGANQLIGRGDMLLSTGAEPIRIQCAFVDTPELEGVMDYIGNQQSYTHPYELPEFQDEGSGSAGMIDLDKRDALFDDAARMLVVHQQGSTSLIQRKLSIGYNRAGRIIDQLEAAGIVGPNEGSKARQVLIPDEYALEQHLSRL